MTSSGSGTASGPGPDPNRRLDQQHDRRRAGGGPRVRSVLLWGGALVLVTAWALLPLLSPSGSPEQAGPSGVRVDPNEVYNPVLAGEPLPDGFRQVLPRDAIRPVYEPEFVAAADVSWDGGAEVIGVEIDGEARAYPVSFLNGREMVIDEIADVPIVVTW